MWYNYAYDAWGNVTVTTHTNGIEATIVRNNPFRYRGYYYDTETGWYYLQSRYYNPTWGRFINADNSDVITATPDQLTDKNLYAYCDNNPVMRSDEDGEFWNFVIGAGVGALVGGISAAVSSYKSTGEVNVGAVLLAAGIGGVSGAIGASGMPIYGQAIASGLLNATNNIATAFIQEEKINCVDLIIDVGIGVGSSLIGSFATKKAADAAENVIERGVKKIVSGVNKNNSGSRYWKGSVKRGLSIMRQGVKNLNTARGNASVIGSALGGGASMLKTGIYALIGD